MNRVAIATYANPHPSATRETEPLVGALRARGIDAVEEIWDGPRAAWSSYDACVVRTTWDYPEKLDAFLAWTREVETRTLLLNAGPLIRWNADKRYLVELAAKGVAIPPTALVERGASALLACVARERGWSELVVKPTIDVAARRAMRVRDPADAAAQAHLDGILARGAALVQEYQPSIAMEGETSLIFVDGAYSHAVRKRVAPGDYRVQEVWGGTAAAVEPTRAQLDAARATLAASPWPALVARVDLVTLADGRPALMELEAIEPALFGHVHPAVSARLAEAIAAQLPDSGK